MDMNNVKMRYGIVGQDEQLYKALDNFGIGYISRQNKHTEEISVIGPVFRNLFGFCVFIAYIIQPALARYFFNHCVCKDGDVFMLSRRF